jgi:hypothetical protein
MKGGNAQPRAGMQIKAVITTEKVYLLVESHTANEVVEPLFNTERLIAERIIVLCSQPSCRRGKDDK